MELWFISHTTSPLLLLSMMYQFLWRFNFKAVREKSNCTYLLVYTPPKKNNNYRHLVDIGFLIMIEHLLCYIFSGYSCQIALLWHASVLSLSLQVNFNLLSCYFILPPKDMKIRRSDLFDQHVSNLWKGSLFLIMPQSFGFLGWQFMTWIMFLKITIKTWTQNIHGYDDTLPHLTK